MVIWSLDLQNPGLFGTGVELSVINISKFYLIFGLKFYWNICRFTDRLSLGYLAHKVWPLTDHLKIQSFQDKLAHVFESYNWIKYMFR